MDGREEQTMVEVQRTWSDCDKIEYDGDGEKINGDRWR